MSGRRSLVGAACVVILMAGAQGSSGADGFDKGTLEVTPQLSFTHSSFSYSGTDQGSLSQLLGSAQIGYCLTDVLEVAGGPIINHVSISSPGGPSDSATQIALIGGLVLNLGGSSRTVPYLRAAFGMQTNSGGGETTMFAPIVEGGVRFLVGNSASLNAGVGYQRLTNAMGIQDLSSNTFGFGLGVSLLRHTGY